MKNWKKLLSVFALLSCATLLLGFSVVAESDSERRKRIAQKLYGYIRVVNSCPDYEVRVVDSCPDLEVRVETACPDRVGLWVFTDSCPDYEIRFVDSCEDISVRFVDSCPGLP